MRIKNLQKLNATYVLRTLLGSLYAFSLILTIFWGTSYVPHFIHDAPTTWLSHSYMHWDSNLDCL